ncbi:glycosyltransferase family 4 protein [Vibrio porteresiae]|uniref:Glycosyltransferase family 4 protein n=1 Tax=Vibrio porteresiae DSM 19223 TaxID=1123496 RepID=A0ABZ0QCV9_9VIBR|nr:glycosyltransferase family 4 protein [Vibrio porteresiae]WPC74230.1 glycosyltransferase family 4 protein [Vibrio porteresiae DSM 19223]
MKICHVNLASGYHGGENQTLQLIKQQIAMGYELTVVANPKSPFAEAIRQLDCRLVLATHYLRSHRRDITQDCQLIHVHEGRAIYWAWLQHLLFKIPYIVTRRIDNVMKKKWLATQAYSNANAVIGLSSDIVQKVHDAYPNIQTFKIPSSPVTYPVDAVALEKIQTQFSGKFLVIHAANMLKHKGFDVTIGAAKLLEKTHPDIHFALLGDGKERADLEQQAGSLSNLTFMGKQSNMGTWFAAADMQVHPSYTEGLGSVILEGLHSGLPVAASRAGGIPDIIEDHVSGLLIEPGNYQALADAILTIKEDAQLRETLATGALEKLQEFRIEHTAKLYQDIYERIDSL